MKETPSNSNKTEGPPICSINCLTIFLFKENVILHGFSTSITSYREIISLHISREHHGRN
jgi:hypothetical protein